MKRTSVCLLLALFAACGDDAPPPQADAREKPHVYTTFYPTTYFARRIAGDRADVICPVPADADPIFWDPPDEAIRAYQEADLIVLNGASFENWVLRVSLPDARVVSTAQPFADRFIQFDSGTTHSHGGEGAHSHKGTDGHTWLDPNLAAIQASEIAAALSRLLPKHAAEFDRRLTELKQDLDGIDATLRALGSQPEGEWLFASHPAYNYIVRTYGWRLVNLDLDPEEMPSDEAFADVRERLAKHPARFLLWEGEPLPEIAARVRDEWKLESIVFSPAEAAPETGDYLAAMRGNLERMRAAFAR